MPPSCAIDSTINTPGSVGRPGKWPTKKDSSPVSSHRPWAETPGSTAMSSVTKRKGGRCGRTSAGRGSSDMVRTAFQSARALRAFLAGAFLAAVFLAGAFLAGTFLAVATFFATAFFGAFLAAAAAFLADFLAGAAAFLAAAFLLDGAVFVAGTRWAVGAAAFLVAAGIWGGGEPAPCAMASSATRRGGSNPAN